MLQFLYSYLGILLMMSPLQPLTKEIDVEFLVFVERYATDLLKWDILTYFAHHPDALVPAATIADRIGRNVQSVRPEAGDLVVLGILAQKTAPDGLLVYRLTDDPYLRRMILKFATPSTAKS
jgi:hypothetical protein